MAQVINTNTLSLKAQNNLNKSQASLGSAIERLSSGLRINSAKDDAAGQAIANRFTANINGLTQAARNANDGISLAQTTEGALGEINNNLQRIRELVVQADNGTNSESDLQSIQSEINQRLSEIDRISQQTQFNSLHVLNEDGTLSVQVGANDGEKIDIHTKMVNTKNLGLDKLDLVNNPRLGGAVTKTIPTGNGGPSGKLELIKADGTVDTDQADDLISYTYKGQSKYVAHIGAEYFVVTVPAPNDKGVISISVQGLTALDGANKDKDEVGEIISAGKGTPIGQMVNGSGGAGIKLNDFLQSTAIKDLKAPDGSALFTDDSKVHYLFNSKGTPTGQYVLSGSDGNFYDIGVDSGGKVTLTGGGAPQINNLVAPLKAVDNAISDVDGMRSDLGAVQNRLASAITNLNNTVNNLSAARSRIEDADYAVEVSNMTRSQILQQAGTAVLSQANQVPQNVLSLLK